MLVAFVLFGGMLLDLSITGGNSFGEMSFLGRGALVLFFCIIGFWVVIALGMLGRWLFRLAFAKNNEEK